MAPVSLDELAGPGVAATFVAAEPPRDSWLALWAFDEAAPGAAGGRDTTRRLEPDAEVELGVPGLALVVAGLVLAWRLAPPGPTPAGIFVAETQGRVVGYITTRIDRDSGKGRIPNLAVATELLILIGNCF